MKFLIICILLTYFNIEVKSNNNLDEYAHCNDRLCGDDLSTKPLCGYNGHGKYQEFENECELEKENCRIQVVKGFVFMGLPVQVCKERVKRAILEDNPIKQKEIDESEYVHCKKTCSNNDAPICGYNGHGGYKLFSSECDMDIENCRVQVRRGFVYMNVAIHKCDN